MDVTDEIEMRNAANQIKSEYGRLDALVHAVGSIPLGPSMQCLDQFQDTINLNLTSHSSQ